MNRKHHQLKKLIAGLFLALLVAFPPVYQSLHIAYSHQHHQVSCCHDDGGNLHQEEEVCEVITFVFYTQSLPDSPPVVFTPVFAQRILNQDLPFWLPADPVLTTAGRAPPVSC